MMCQRIGRPPISTIGLGRSSVSSVSRVPCPPARMTTFMRYLLQLLRTRFVELVHLSSLTMAVRDQGLAPYSLLAPSLRPCCQLPEKLQRRVRKNADGRAPSWPSSP